MNVHKISRRIIVCSGLLVLFASTSFAQEATVLRNVNLRADPSTANPPIKLLQSGTTITLLAPTQHGGFYHVKTEDGEEGWVWSKNIAVSAIPSLAPSTSAGCDDSLWDHVYNPQRLIVKQKCIAVTGTTVDATSGKNADGVRHEADGDTHGWLKLDADFTNLLNAGNLSDEGGNMVFEIVCKYRVTQADAKAACPQTYHNQVQLPPVGSHVRIVGTYVQDTNHAKWMEIHPVTSITVIP
jgi:uncharacterized protein YgiM (DUF1202 family)